MASLQYVIKLDEYEEKLVTDDIPEALRELARKIDDVLVEKE